MCSEEAKNESGKSSRSHPGEYLGRDSTSREGQERPAGSATFGKERRRLAASGTCVRSH